MPHVQLDCLGPAGWRVRGDVVNVAVDGEGTLRDLRIDGTQVICAGPVPCLWRAPTDNDEYGGYAETWRRAGLDAQSRQVQALRAWQPLPQVAVVQVDWMLHGVRGQKHSNGYEAALADLTLPPPAEPAKCPLPDAGPAG